MKKLILAVMLSVLLLGFGSAMAADSSIDNVPGGAAVTYVQASPAGWETLVNIQNLNAVFRRLHITLWDGDSNHILDWSVCLTPFDNYGVIIGASDATGGVTIADYMDSFPAANTIPDWASPPPVPATFATFTAAGVAYGYLTMVNSGWSGIDCPTAMGNSQYSQAFPTIATDNILVREAWVSPTEAMAMNAAMLQGFVNMGTGGFTETVNTTTGCSMNFDLDFADHWASIDDGVGTANIDWYELFITDNGLNVLTAAVALICDPINALGASYAGPLDTVPAAPRYWARFNENATQNTTLVTVAPDLTHAPSAAGFDRYDHLVQQAHTFYNDAEAPGSVGTTCEDEVCYTIFGPGLNELHIGGVEAGELMINIPYPIFGFVYTEGAAWSDIYPFVATQKARWDAGLGVVILIP